MRAITKSAEPPSLTAHRLAPYCNYDNYADRDALRNALATEQRGLCCYCMDRIRSEQGTMKIEHWRCQARYPGEQLNYRNLLGACPGGQGLPAHLQHCDTRKGDRDLQWNLQMRRTKLKLASDTNRMAQSARTMPCSTNSYTKF